MMNSTNPDESSRRHWLIPVLAGIFIVAVILATTYTTWQTRAGFARGEEIMDAIIAGGPAGVLEAQQPFVDAQGQWFMLQRLVRVGNTASVSVLGYRVVYTLPQADGSVILLEVVMHTKPLDPSQAMLANSWERVTLRPDGTGSAEYAFFEIPRDLRFAPQALTAEQWTLTPITAIEFNADNLTYTPRGDAPDTDTIPTPQAYLPMGLWPLAAQRVAQTQNDALFNSLIPQPDRDSRFFTRLEEISISPLNAKQIAHIKGAHSGVSMAQATSRGMPTMVVFDEQGRVLERQFEHMTETRTPPPQDAYLVVVLNLVADQLFPVETPDAEEPPTE